MLRDGADDYDEELFFFFFLDITGITFVTEVLSTKFSC